MKPDFPKTDFQPDALMRSLPNRSARLRRVITETAQRELIKDGEV